jgi:hypothetical protein
MFVDLYPGICEILELIPPGHLVGRVLSLNPKESGKEQIFVCNHQSHTLLTDRYRLSYYFQAEEVNFKGNASVNFVVCGQECPRSGPRSDKIFTNPASRCLTCGSKKVYRISYILLNSFYPSYVNLNPGSATRG